MPQTCQLKVANCEEARTLLRQRLSHISGDAETARLVASVIEDVRARGDAAVLEYTSRFDKLDLDAASMRVTAEEIGAAVGRLAGGPLAHAIEHAHRRITAFHERQKQESWVITGEGSLFGQIVKPLAAVGLYVPGGQAPYPSTVLMNAVPANVAGVPRIVMTSPAKNISDAVLYAAHLCQVTEIWKIGGAQAVAALALGTASIAPVDKICGPGNRFVAEAKRQLFGIVDIDMVAGPSEIMIYADAASDPETVISDLFSQAEHDADAVCILVSESAALINAINERLAARVALEPRAGVIAQSLMKNGMAVTVAGPAEAYDVINLFAPEHLEILAKRPIEEVLSEVSNAGAIFYGAFAPEALGDYIAGPNHTLPTSGTARFASPLGVYDFQKRSSLLAPSRELYATLCTDAALIARAEGFEAHARSVLGRADKT